VRRQRDRRLGAYRDGELSPRARQRLERFLERDAESTQQLRQLEALGTAIREAWNEGPAAPSPEFLVNALRSEFPRVDEEQAARSLGRRLIRRLSEWLRPVPVTALAGSALAALLVVWLGSPVAENGHPVAAAGLPSLASPAAIYELDQAESSWLVYELEDGVTVIWLLEENEAVSGLSRAEPWV